VDLGFRTSIIAIQTRAHDQRVHPSTIVKTGDTTVGPTYFAALKNAISSSLPDPSKKTVSRRKDTTMGLIGARIEAEMEKRCGAVVRIEASGFARCEAGWQQPRARLGGSLTRCGAASSKRRRET
jgi:hypothetical protein